MNNTSLIPLLLAGIVVILVLFFGIVLSIQFYLRRQKAVFMEKAQLVHQHEQQLMNARLEEQERVMTQVSRDMHDNLSQQLGFLQMNLKGMKETTSNPAQQQKYIETCQAISVRISSEMRNMTYSLNSDYIRAHGLGELLDKEVRHINSGNGLACRLEIEGIYYTLPADTELIIYRIAQEAIHNVIKHAHAGHVFIRLRYAEHAMHLYISDDGIGFDPASSRFVSGLGLRNMEQRALLLDARLKVDAVPGSGCNIMLTVDKPQ